VAWFILLGSAAALWLTRPSPHAINTSHAAQQTQHCQENLSRIARAFAQYAQDYDGKFPRGVDPEDRYNPTLWTDERSGGNYRQDAHTAPMLNELLQSYLPDKEVWHCPADRGYERSSLPGFATSLRNVYPSSFAKYGMSYYYLTIHGFAGMRAIELRDPSSDIIVFDGDIWHQTEGKASLNVLFADGHVQNLLPQRFQELQNENERSR
jgi:prepilin-type processing-associated H-X9-DG protein